MLKLSTVIILNFMIVYLPTANYFQGNISGSERQIAFWRWSSLQMSVSLFKLPKRAKTH